MASFLVECEADPDFLRWGLGFLSIFRVPSRGIYRVLMDSFKGIFRVQGLRSLGGFSVQGFRE